MAIGKISGPMLQTNLARQGVDLSVDTNLVYFDVTNRRLGVGTNSPIQALDVPGNVRLANLTILGNTITSDTGKINLGNIGNVQITGGAANYIIYTDGSGNLSFGNLDVLSGLEGFTANYITLGANTVGSFGNAVGLTVNTTVTDAIALLNLNLGNFQSNVGAYETYANANAVSLSSSIQGANTAIVTANTAVVNYVNTLNTAMVSNITAANAAIVTANTALKNYVDSANSVQSNLIITLQGQVYANANVAAYLPGYSGNITANTFTGNVNTNYISASTGNVVTIRGTGALAVPVGSTANRPTGQIGDIRFNTDILVSTLEFFNGTTWIPFQNSITDQQLTPDGTSTSYTLNQGTANAESLLVSINGTVQRPGAGSAYTVSGGNIVFAEAPLSTDIVDIRYIASAVSTALTGIASDISTSGNISAANIATTNGVYWANGASYSSTINNYSNANVAAYLPSYTGNVLASNVTASVFYVGNVVVNNPNVSISGTGPTIVDYFFANTYRSVNYSIQSSRGSVFQVNNLWVIQDGTQAYLTATGASTTANLGAFSAVLTGSNVQLYFTPTGSNTQLRVYKTQFVI
jgi:hypothetical protein